MGEWGQPVPLCGGKTSITVYCERSTHFILSKEQTFQSVSEAYSCFDLSQQHNTKDFPLHSPVSTNASTQKVYCNISYSKTRWGRIQKWIKVKAISKIRSNTCLVTAIYKTSTLSLLLLFYHTEKIRQHNCEVFRKPYVLYPLWMFTSL